MITAIDLFAGVGGFTEAAGAAGIHVVWAADHWKAAVDIHALNHPATAHSCQDLHQQDWEQVPAHDFLLASPCCQGHAKARGADRPHHDKSRSTAWAVVSCAEYHKPKVVVVENVPEFRNWALFPSWQQAMESLGYCLSINMFDAADTGTPQNRLRLFIVMSRSKHPMSIAAPTQPHRPASGVIEWDRGNWTNVLGNAVPPRLAWHVLDEVKRAA